MNFLIISEVVHKQNHKKQVAAYAPYVREMNLWIRHFDEVTIIAPVTICSFDAIDSTFDHPNINFQPYRFLNFSNSASFVRSALQLPYVFFVLFRQMQKADHIHLRCPASIGLLACFVQVFFPYKTKTAKYAGNWDWNSHQPFSYRLQQHILQNEFISKKMKVLVYGEWKDATRNMKPFFTASYSEMDKLSYQPKTLATGQKLLFVFVGTFSKNKNPLLSIYVVEKLAKDGVLAEINMFGSGEEMMVAELYVQQNNLQHIVRFHYNQSSAVIKEYLICSHFLLFASQSEGWPKVVAEAMFWGCVPITTAVSCVPQMLGFGSRGKLITPTVESMCRAVEEYLLAPDTYALASEDGKEWSRQFTLEKMAEAIGKLIIEKNADEFFDSYERSSYNKPTKANRRLQPLRAGNESLG